jgi:signal transduction histidine kinase/CheY-like chemotaxis protein
VLLICGLFTVAGSAFVSHTARTRDELRFASEVQDIRASLAARIETYVALLRAASALFAASEAVSSAEFSQFSTHLELRERFKGVQGIGFSRRYRTRDLNTIDREIRAATGGTHRLYPRHTRDEYHAIVFLEPHDARNLRALGYDMFSDPVRRVAMEEARDTGRPVASGRVTLVQEIDPESQQAGFLIYLPVYRDSALPPTIEGRRDALDGFVYSPFRAGDLLESLLQPENRRLLIVRIYDGLAQDPGALLYDSSPAWEGEDTGLQSVTRMPVAGRPWTIAIEARAPFMSATPAVLPTILGLGLGVSLLLFLLTRAEASARARAEATAGALQRSEEQLQAANRAKDEFLATLSHELRTPLNAILGWVRMLRLGTIEPSRHADALAVIERNARVQVQLIEDLLDVSRIITGKMRLDLRMVAVNAVLAEAATALRPAADAKRVNLEWAPDASAGSILAAPDRLQQIVWNLLSNAIKFTPAGGTVTLTTERRPDELRIVVRDTGAGIEPSFLPHVFERFRQADSTTTRAHSGMGLGLAIVRHLIELHGGTIEAASEGVGRGACFTVRLPVRDAVPATPRDGQPATEHARRVAATRPLQGRSVLVVDDEPDSRQLVASALRAHGAHVHVASSVQDALGCVSAEPIDLLVTDLAMPGEDGYSLVRRLRGPDAPRRGPLPVVALTAFVRAEDRDRVMAEGFDGFLAKPVEIDELVATVARLTEG